MPDEGDKDYDENAVCNENAGGGDGKKLSDTLSFI
jgi:hypothetical protein